jgi:hypothetical protein
MEKDISVCDCYKPISQELECRAGRNFPPSFPTSFADAADQSTGVSCSNSFAILMAASG